MNGKKEGLSSQVKQLGILTTIPIILLVGPAVGFLMGGWLDRKAHFYPWLTVIFTTLGFVASGRETYRLLKDISRDDRPR